MNETRQLAHFVAATNFEDIPRDVTEFAKILLLDNFACGFVGSIQPWSIMVAQMIQEGASREECTVFGQKWRTNASGAALVNGAMIGAFESEHADPIGAHPGGNVFPAVMAIAEREHKDGKSFLAAMILGYEVTCRIAEAATRAVEDVRGFHTPATNGQFGAAVAVGKLLGLDEATLASAMGIAGSHCGGVIEFKWEGAMTKRLHLGRAGQMGLESAILASKGFTGPSTIVEGKFGYLNVYSPSPRPQRLLEDIGKVWFGKTLQMIKPYSVHGTQLAVVHALLEFKVSHRLDIKDIRRVVVAGNRQMKHTHDDREPKTIMGAQYSMPFVVAITLTRNIADPYVLNEDTLWDPEVRDLAMKIETVEDQRFASFDVHHDPHAEITIEMSRERHVIAVSGFKGMPKNQFTFEDARDKFLRYGVPIIGKDKADEIIEKVVHIERLSNTAELAHLIAI